MRLISIITLLFILYCAKVNGSGVKMPGDQVNNQGMLFPFSAKKTNVALDHYQTKFDRHCVQCGIVIANQAIEKSRSCPNHHSVDLRGGEKGQDRFMLSSWGRCKYCDNFIAAHHKFCPCCGRVHDKHDDNKNGRLHRALVKTERHTARCEINKLLQPLNLHLGLNSHNEYYIVHKDESEGSSRNVLALQFPSPVISTPGNTPRPQEVDKPAVVIAELTSPNATVPIVAADISLNEPCGLQPIALKDGEMDYDDPFISILDIHDVTLGESGSSQSISEGVMFQPLTQTEPSQGSSRSSLGVGGIQTMSGSMSSSSDDINRPSSQCSRQLRPRPSYRNSGELSAAVVEPAKKKTRKSFEKKSNREDRVKESCDENVVDLTFSSDEDRFESEMNKVVKSESDE